jgi:ABC-type branched-subunit amino acid transport system substrate-binding protein
VTETSQFNFSEFPQRASIMLMKSRFFCLVVCTLLFAAITPLRSEQPPANSRREFKVGLLVSLTGSWNSLGQNTVAALQIANDQLKATAKAEHGGYRLCATPRSIPRKRSPRFKTSTNAA